MIQIKQLAASSLLALLAVGCQNTQRVTVPNRALDRPMDTVLACAQVNENGIMTVTSAAACGSEAGQEGAALVGDCDPDRPQLIGLVSNSETNEIGMWRRCDKNGLVDLDPGSPGYNFLPAGTLPQEMTITTDACRAVSANVQSCDLSVIDVEGTVGLAFDVPEPVDTAALSWQVVPLRGDGLPLGARPGDVVAVPGPLSLAGDAAQPATLGAPGALGGGIPDATTGAGVEGYPLCSAEAPYSVYVTFPTCQLVAEVSLATGQILQSRKFTRTQDGFEVTDAGPDPSCPVECPEQFDDPSAAGGPAEPNGLFPATLELVLANLKTDSPDAADSFYQDSAYDALFVGGPGGDVLFEIPVTEAGFGPADLTNALLLEKAEGIHRVRATPPMELGDSAFIQQFLYLVAGDGSTRVVLRDFEDEFGLGVECDTQLDVTEVLPGLDTQCHPVDPTIPGDPPERRPLAIGPGIRAPGGAAITDWVFFKKRCGEGCDESEESDSTLANPVGLDGVVGVGVTSFGRGVMSIFGQSNTAIVNPADDPLELLDVTLRPHMLWPAGKDEEAVPLPRVADEEPRRQLPGDGSGSQVLSPTLRRIDLAYTIDGSSEPSPAQELRFAALGQPANEDSLGAFAAVGSADGALYENSVVRVVARDYRRYTSATWSIIWEGIIPGTTSSTGELKCAVPGWEGGTCLVPPAHDLPPFYGMCESTDDCPSLYACVNSTDPGVRVCEYQGGSCTAAAPACAGGFTCDTALSRCVQDCASDGDCDPNGDGILACDAERGGCRLSDEARSSSATLLDDGAAFCDEGVLAGDKIVILGCDDDGDCGIGQACLQDLSGGTGICFSEQEIAEREEELRSVCGPFIVDPCGPAQREYLVTRVTQEEMWLQALQIPERAYLAPDPNAPPPLQVPDPSPPASNPDATLEFPVGAFTEQFARFSCILPDGVEQPAGGCESDEECQDVVGEEYLCVDDVCRIPCERVDDVVDGFQNVDACRLAPLPGPSCFPEFLRYQVRLRNAFLVAGNPAGTFFPDQVVADAVTGECRVDPTISPLLSSRIALGRDEAETFGEGPGKIPACGSDEPSSSDPNPCRVVKKRAEGEGTRYHTLGYFGRDIPAIRFTNPYISVVLDLVSLASVSEEMPDEDAIWRPDVYCPVPLEGANCPVATRSFAQFFRARIPDNYRETFDTIAGYTPVNYVIVVGGTVPVTYPVRLVPGPELGRAYVVDAGGVGGIRGVRGQVVRIGIETAPLSVVADEQFLVR